MALRHKDLEATPPESTQSGCRTRAVGSQVGGTSWWRGPPIRKCSPEGTRQLDQMILAVPSNLVLCDSITWVRQAKDRLQAQHRGGSLGSRAGKHLSSARMERSEEHKETETEGAPLLLYQEKCFTIFC